MHCTFNRSHGDNIARYAPVCVTAQGVLGQKLRYRLLGLALRRNSWVPAVREDVGRGHGGGFHWVLLVSFGFCQFLFEDW
jgi:hypothetical protein